ncbi:MAG TPA: M1 family metallopeptidase [Candidatus Saccharimonadales bacterium]|nr:M1 family metallopeptidase [Candidatus Saccharimonadales bacterium]
MIKRAARLFETFQPEHYTLFLDPDRDSKVVRGTATITGLKKGRPSQRLTFHQNGLKITEATVTRHDKKGDQTFTVSRINHQNSLNEVRLHADAMLYGGSYTVTMQFSGKINDGEMHGIYPCYYELDGERRALIGSQFESHHAREAFPCIDEPEAKATFDLTLASPVGESVLSNTPIKTQDTKGDRLHTTFETTPRMSTYLLAFVYGDMQWREAKTKSGVIVRVWSSKVHSLESLDFALDVTRRGIEFFDDYYGVPYPLAKCDMVALPDFSAGAMENWGAITFRESVLIAEPKTISQSSKEYIALVVCHELSHQWFGNLVTMKWWDDLWLNESFANVMEYVGPNALFPEWNVFDMFAVNEGLSAFRRDALPSVQAIRTDVRHPDQISTIFDPSIVYAKGGRLINMLRNYLGDDVFRKGLKAYFTKHAYGNTTRDDLWAALSEASGKDVGAFMNPWLEQSNFPVVQVDQAGTSLTVTQSHFTLDPSKTDASRRWPVPLLSGTAGVPALLETKQIASVLTDDAYTRINTGALGHYIVRYKNKSHAQAIAAQVDDKSLSVAERLMLLSDSSLLARAAMQSFASTLELLQHYAKENSEPVWDIMSLILGDARRFIDAEPGLESTIKAQIRTLIQSEYERLGWNEHTDESSQDTKLRASILGLGVYAEHPTITKQALALFEQYKADDSVVSGELRDIVFAAAIRNKADGAFDYLLKLEQSTQNPELKNDARGALTITRDPAQATMLLGRLKDSKKVRPQDVDHWLVLIMRNRYTQQEAWDWLRDNWQWIEQMFKADKSYDYFPRYAASALNTRKRLEEYKAFFEPMQDQIALQRNIVMGIEELTTRVAWIERDLADVKKYYKL